MSIKRKILFGYILVILLFSAMIFYGLEKGKQSLIEYAGQSSTMIARSIIDKIDNNIDTRLNHLRWYGLNSDLRKELIASNSQFAAMVDRDTYIAEMDNKWTNTPPQEFFPLMTAIQTSELSYDLRKLFFSFFEVTLGHQYYAEVFVTNKYGVNIAQTNRTSDYLQADEEWWQEALKKGHYIGEIQFDESSAVLGLAVAVRVDDNDGAFLGVIKGIVPLQGLLRTAEIAVHQFQTTEIQVVAKNGTLLYSSKAMPLGKGITKEPYFQNIQGKSGYFIEKNIFGRSRLFAYMRSTGLLDSPLLDWIVLVSHDEEEILSKTISLEKKILIAGFITLLLMTIIAFSIGRMISRPLTLLKKASTAIGEGNLESQIQYASRDEFGDVARTFNHMVSSLSDSYLKLQREIEERKQIEADLTIRTEELSILSNNLAKRNAELDEFTYVASHDLQEPLRKITSFSSLLPKDLGEELPENAKKDLYFITDAAIRMQDLIQDLLALSRSGRREMVSERIPLDQCINDVLHLLSTRLEETEAEINRDKFPEIMGDRVMITQLYQNLLSNALKFVRGRRPLIHLSSRIQGGWAVLGVQDNGIGIKSEYTEQIFQPFKRLHGKTEFAGSGIGLAICRKVVERHGGEIWVESEPGQGTVFRFTLPRALEQEHKKHESD